MPRPKPEPKKKPAAKPIPKPRVGTKGTHMRLTPDDLAATDRIVAHYHLDGRAAAVRLAVYHHVANLAPLTISPTAKKKS